MAGDHRWRWLVPTAVRNLPADLAVILVLVALTTATVSVPILADTPLRVVFGLPFVLFVPGYAFTAALYPEAGEPVHSDCAHSNGQIGDDAADDAVGVYVKRDGIDGVERVSLSFALNIAAVSLIGLVLNFTPLGIRVVPIMILVSGFTVVCVAVAAIRRAELPEQARFSVPYRRWYAAVWRELLDADTRGESALNIVVVCTLVFALASVSYAVMVPTEGELMSELFLLTESDTGELVADDYPTEFRPGERRPIVVGIHNYENEPVNYTVIVKLQRVTIQRTDNTTTVTVQQETELGRFQSDIAHNETRRERFTIAPEITGRNLRLAFLLYRSAPPSIPSVENAYRKTQLWINVTEPR